VSALASEPLELAAPVQRPTRARGERLRLVSRPAPRFIGSSLPQELLNTWGSALTWAESALVAAAWMNVYTPDELQESRNRLREERRWLKQHMEIQAFGPLTSRLLRLGRMTE
jgi:hypothetical protein